MNNKIINGKLLAETILNGIEADVKKLTKRKPALAVVLVALATIIIVVVVNPFRHWRNGVITLHLQAGR